MTPSTPRHAGAVALDGQLAAPLLHIGFHKTATTWLQTTVFDGPCSPFWLPWDRPTINQHFLLSPTWSFDPKRSQTQLLERVRGDQPGKTPVISNENLSGNPYVGDGHARSVADRLHAVFPRSKVFIVIREQRSMIRSGYLQYVREGGGASLEQYLSPPRGIHRAPVFSPKSYQYDGLIEEYLTLFGPDSVLVLPFEMLAQDTRGFVDRISDHAGAERCPHLSDVRPQAALGPFTTAVKRQVNRLFVRDAINPSPVFDAPLFGLVLERALVAADPRLPRRLRSLGAQRMSTQLERAALPDYGQSNRRVEELTGLDLASLGYA